MAFSIETRATAIEQLKTDEFDVLIIGGGITGAGVAVQTSAAGMKTGLIEMQDFAEGTSSRSTKLVHGGIRYLKRFDVDVVSDTVTERAVVQHIAPHIPKPALMLLPIYEEPGATFNMFSVKVAMDLYDQLAQITGGQYANYTVTKEELLERQPLIRQEGLLGGGVYLDFVNNDARLVIETIKQAAADEGQMVSRVQVIGFIFKNKQVAGVKAKDLTSDEVFEVKAKVVINTAGPWVDDIRQLATTKEVIPHIRPTKGVHLVIDSSRLAVPQPTYLDTGKGDGRMFFVVPRGNKTYFGTTDTDYQGALAEPIVEQADVDYLLESLNYRYPEAAITLADIEASWAGLRPLIASNSSSDYNGGNRAKVSDESFNQLIEIVVKFEAGQVDRSAVETQLANLDSQLSESDQHPSAVSRGSYLERDASGLLTLAGGKITDYRKMAEGAVIAIKTILHEEFNRDFQLIDSKNYQVSGGKIDPTKVEDILANYANEGVESGLSKQEAMTLAELYGSNTPQVLSQLVDFEGFKGLSIGESLGLNYAMNEEMTLTPADYLMRRTNHLLFRRETVAAIKLPIIDAMAQRFNWTKDEKDTHVEVLERVIAESDLAHLKK